MRPSSVLLFFVDGLGISRRSTFSHTCLFSIDSAEPCRELPYDGLLIAADAQLGVPGLPQSATGQTALFTGVNAPVLMGRHVSGMPGPTLREVIRRNGIFSKLIKRGMDATELCFANGFTPPFFKGRVGISVSTWHAQTAGVRLRTLQDLSAGEALYHDFTNASLIKRGFSLPLLSSQEAGEVLAGIVQQHRFTVYEYFLTDLVGHGRVDKSPFQVMRDLDLMLCSLLECLPLGDVAVVLTSDHGNVEDVNRTTHTTNPVPVMVWGVEKEYALSVRTIQDIPGLVETLLATHLTAMPTSEMSALLQRPITLTTSP